MEYQFKKELHIFVDASDRAVAAVAYIRGLGPNGITTSIVASKCKVAPMGQLSIPRLELQAGVLGVRLSEMIHKACSNNINITSTTYWTDARDVMCWINSAKRRYRPYVGIRITEILSVSKISDWRWVPGKMNPADLATNLTTKMQ